MTHRSVVGTMGDPSPYIVYSPGQQGSGLHRLYDDRVEADAFALPRGYVVEPLCRFIRGEWARGYAAGQAGLWRAIEGAKPRLLDEAKL